VDDVVSSLWRLAVSRYLKPSKCICPGALTFSSAYRKLLATTAEGIEQPIPTADGHKRPSPYAGQANVLCRSNGGDSVTETARGTVAKKPNAGITISSSRR
jgi:hypothetical protein